MTRLFLLAAFLFAACVVRPAYVTAAPPVAEAYTIETVRGNVYRFTAGNYRSVFMVTNDGIIVTDPISTEAATYLKAELARRFNKPVRFVLYRHNHADHVYGGEVFAGPNTHFVAQELARNDLVRTQAKTQIPDVTAKNELTVSLGGSQVHLRYHRPNNGRGSVSMRFEPAHVLYVVDWITLGRLPWKDLQGYDIQGMMDSTDDVLQMDFAVFVGGHADMGSKADVKRYRGYLEDLYSAVLSRIQQGKSLAVLQRDIRLDKYKDYKMYAEWLPFNIEGTYKTLVDQSYLFYRPDIPKPATP